MASPCAGEPCGSPAPRRWQTGQRGQQQPFAALKQRQLLFLLVRQLAEAQFVRADQALSERLWQEAAALDLDPDRIIHLLYGVADPNDPLEMEAADRRYGHDLPPEGREWWAPRWGFLTGRRAGVLHQSAPPAGSPAHP